MKNSCWLGLASLSMVAVGGCSSGAPSGEETRSSSAAVTYDAPFEQTPFTGPLGSACSYELTCYGAAPVVQVLCPTSDGALTITSGGAPATIVNSWTYAPGTQAYDVAIADGRSYDFDVCDPHSSVNPCGFVPLETPTTQWCASPGYPVTPSTASVILTPGDTLGLIQLFAPVVGSTTFSIAGLPAGVTATPKPISASPEGVEYDFVVAKTTPLTTAPVPVVVSTTTATGSGTATFGAQTLELSIAGVCAPNPESQFECGTPVDGCGDTYSLPACPTGFGCSSAYECVLNRPIGCPKRTHSCGDGTCGIVCG
jgi:hypothetical protein